MIGLLSRREHSRKELVHKLLAKGTSVDTIKSVLDHLARENLQSDERFTEVYIHSRTQKGYGPVRLNQELRERGIEDNMIERCLDNFKIEWMEILTNVRNKKFGASPPADFKERSRQSHFLQYRGFTGDQIKNLYRGDD